MDGEEALWQEDKDSMEEELSRDRRCGASWVSEETYNRMQN